MIHLFVLRPRGEYFVAALQAVLQQRRPLLGSVALPFVLISWAMSFRLHYNKLSLGTTLEWTELLSQLALILGALLLPMWYAVFSVLLDCNALPLHDDQAAERSLGQKMGSSRFLLSALLHLPLALGCALIPVVNLFFMFPLVSFAMSLADPHPPIWTSIARCFAQTKKNLSGLFALCFVQFVGVLSFAGLVAAGFEFLREPLDQLLTTEWLERFHDYELYFCLYAALALALGVLLSILAASFTLFFAGHLLEDYHQSALRRLIQRF